MSNYNDDVGPEVMFVDYGTVAFEAANANTVMLGGEEGSVGTDGAKLVLQERGNETLTRVSATSNSVTVTYSEPKDT